ncbi:MAG: hypothetical protein ABI472_10425 [Ginsengibacter sp.]
MKVLIFGPSASGKTYLSQALQNLGIHAFDGDDIEGLSAWYNKNGKKIVTPENADEAITNHYSFLWSKKFLTNFLSKFSTVYIFGGSGNITHMFDLFDKIYFLKANPEIQRKRLQSVFRKNPMMDRNEKGLMVWGDWLEEVAQKKGITFLDASQTPEQIFEIISQ